MSVRTTENSLVESLQCPVCMTFPTAPIFGCQNGHIICQSCQSSVQHCPICRSEKFNVRNIIAETMLKSPIFKCAYRGLGCPHPRMTADEYTNHVKDCEYREVECYCTLGDEECYGTKVPKIDYMNHMVDYHGAQRSNLVTYTVQCEMGGNFTPTRFSCFGETFLLMSHKNYDGTRFWTWVTHENKRGLDQEFLIKITLRYFFGREEIKVHSDVFPPSKILDTPEAVLKSGHCMEFSATTAPPTMPPMVWPGYFPGVDDQPGHMWGYDVEVKKWEMAPVQKPKPVYHERIRAAATVPTAATGRVPIITAVSAVPIPGNALPPPQQHEFRFVLDGNNRLTNLDQLVNQLNNMVHGNPPIATNILNQLVNQLNDAIRGYVPGGTDFNQLLNDLNNTLTNMPAAAATNENLEGNELNNIQNPAALAPPELAIVELQRLNAEELQELEDYSSSEDEGLDRDERIRTAENRSRSPSPLAKRMATGENEAGQPLEPNTNDHHDFLNDGSGDDEEYL